MGSSESSQVDMNSPQAEFVKSKISDNCVVVFSKTTCPYCSMAKRTLDSVGAKYELIELDRIEDGSNMQDILLTITGARTVPRVFIGGKCIGGGSETKSLHSSGKLVPMLQECGAIVAQ